MRILGVVLLAIAFSLGTWFGGWIAVPAIAVVYAFWRRDIRAPREAGVAALVSWLALLVRLKPNPAFNTLLAQLGQLFPVPGIGVAALTLLFAVILAASAARLTIGLVGVRGAAPS
jgi:hypothetical protein